MLTHRTVGSVMTREVVRVARVVRVAPATGFRDIVEEVPGHVEGASPAAVRAEVTHGRAVLGRTTDPPYPVPVTDRTGRTPEPVAVTAGTSGHRNKEVRHGNHP